MDSTKTIAGWVFAVVVVLVFLSSPAHALVERYKNQTDYLNRLSQLGYDTLAEGFESIAWDAVRSNYPNIVSTPSVYSNGLTWASAGRDIWYYPWSSKVYGVTTNNNWARTGDWGLYEDHKGDPIPTTIRITSPTPLYAIGGYFDTNPDLEGVAFLFEGQTTAEEPGYVVPGIGALYPGDNKGYGHNFNGYIFPDRFTDVILTGVLEINEENQLEGGTYFGVDDFTFAVPAGYIPPPPHPGDFNNDGQIDAADLALVLGNWGASNTPASAPFWTSNWDGFVDANELAALLSNWGAGVSSPADIAHTAVPEPGTVLLIGMLCFVSSPRRNFTQHLRHSCEGRNP